MAHLATHEFLSSLKALYPEKSSSSYLERTWYLAAAVAFAASNEPQAVPRVYEYALEDLTAQSAPESDKILLVRKIKDALFKSGLLCGYPKAINALASLHAVLPEEYKDAKPLRDTSLTIDRLHELGQANFDQTYGDTRKPTQKFLNEIFPDFEYFSTTFAYGFVYGFSGVLTAAETSFAIVAALIATDVPRQIEWHINGAVRNGASPEVVKAIRQISIEVAKAAGLTWKGDIPDLA